MLNIAMFLYHYSYGKHHFFYPFADVDIQDNYKRLWLWPLFSYGDNRYGESDFFLFSYINTSYKKSIGIFSPLLFSYSYYYENYNKTVSESSIFPYGILWRADAKKDSFDQQILGGAIYRNSKNVDSRHFSLLYKFFSYHRFKNNEKWEFFPFIKVLKNHNSHSYSFCWNFLEKHNGGGHIFFIPYGEKSGIQITGS